MKTTDETMVAQNAWVLWKILAELEALLWDLHGDEFLDFEEGERMVCSVKL